jgi:hypothetical protein
MSEEIENTKEVEDESEGEALSIPLCPDFASAMQWAMLSRRGSLLKAAPMPEPEQLTGADMEQLRDILAGLIDILGHRERQLMAAAEDLQCVEEMLEGVPDLSVHNVLRTCKEAYKVVTETAEALRAPLPPEDELAEA